MFPHLGPNASSFAGDIDNLFWLIAIIVGLWFIAAEGVFFWLILRFRARGRPGEASRSRRRRTRTPAHPRRG